MGEGIRFGGSESGDFVKYITILSPPAQTGYMVGDALDLTGIVVAAVTRNGNTIDVTNDCVFSPTAGTTLSVDNTSVDITYTWHGATYKAVQPISVTTVKIVSWADGTDDEIVAMVQEADKGNLNLSEFWAVGDIRTVQLSDDAAQEVDLVLVHEGGYELEDGSICNFVVGQKDSLSSELPMGSLPYNTGSWNSCKMRTYLNGTFKDIFPATLLPIFKPFKTKTASSYNSTELTTSIDYFALPAMKEVIGGSEASDVGDATGYSNVTEFNALFQFDYYKTESNRIKKLGKSGNAEVWWTRSPYGSSVNGFCCIDEEGSYWNYIANNSWGASPFGCI